MQQLTEMLNSQKVQIEKDLKELDTKEWDLKLQRSKLSKMLKTVNKQLETANNDVPTK